MWRNPPRGKHLPDNMPEPVTVRALHDRLLAEFINEFQPKEEHHRVHINAH